MSAAILVLPTKAAVDLAWQHYASMARRLADSPQLGRDAGFVDELGKREAEWRTLYEHWTKRT